MGIAIKLQQAVMETMSVSLKVSQADMYTQLKAIAIIESDGALIPYQVTTSKGMVFQITETDKRELIGLILIVTLITHIEEISVV